MSTVEPASKRRRYRRDAALPIEVANLETKLPTVRVGGLPSRSTGRVGTNGSRTMCASADGRSKSARPAGSMCCARDAAFRAASVRTTSSQSARLVSTAPSHMNAKPASSGLASAKRRRNSQHVDAAREFFPQRTFPAGRAFPRVAARHSFPLACRRSRRVVTEYVASSRRECDQTLHEFRMYAANDGAGYHGDIVAPQGRGRVCCRTLVSNCGNLASGRQTAKRRQFC